MRAPSLRVTLTEATAPGGGGGVYGPAAAELRQPPQPWSLPARTPTTYVFALSAPNVRVLVRTFVWSSTGACHDEPPSVVYVTWYFVAPSIASHDAVTVPSARVIVTSEGVPGAAASAVSGASSPLAAMAASARRVRARVGMSRRKRRAPSSAYVTGCQLSLA